MVDYVNAGIRLFSLQLFEQVQAVVTKALGIVRYFVTHMKFGEDENELE